MTNSSYKLAAILMIGAAVAASPALAQSVSGSRPAELPVNRGAPFSFPDTTPAPTPRVDASTSRDIFEIDPATLLDELATVSLSVDGEVTEAAPSEALRAIIETWVKGSTGQ
jgi:hypothetical protein